MWCKCEASLLSEYCFIWFFQNITFCTYPFLYFLHLYWGRRGCDRMVVGFTTTYAISAYHHWCEFEFRSGRDVQHYVIKVCQWLVTDQWFSAGPPVSSTNKADRHDIAEIMLKVMWKTIKPSCWDIRCDFRVEQSSLRLDPRLFCRGFMICLCCLYI